MKEIYLVMHKAHKHVVLACRFEDDAKEAVKTLNNVFGLEMYETKIVQLK